jgi:hypothetical protein
MFYMMTIFAILCIVALLAMAICIPHSTEVPTMSPDLLAQADALEARENAQRFSDNNTIRSVANRFGARVPTRTTVAALRIANLAADIACEPRAVLLAAVGTPDTAEEARASCGTPAPLVRTFPVRSPATSSCLSLQRGSTAS